MRNLSIAFWLSLVVFLLLLALLVTLACVQHTAMTDFQSAFAEAENIEDDSKEFMNDKMTKATNELMLSTFTAFFLLIPTGTLIVMARKFIDKLQRISCSDIEITVISLFVVVLLVMEFYDAVSGAAVLITLGNAQVNVVKNMYERLHDLLLIVV